MDILDIFDVWPPFGDAGPYYSGSVTYAVFHAADGLLVIGVVPAGP